MNKKIVFVSYTDLSSGVGHLTRILSMLSYLRSIFGNEKVDWLNIVPGRLGVYRSCKELEKQYQYLPGVNRFIPFVKLLKGRLSWVFHDAILPIYGIYTLFKYYGFGFRPILWVAMVRTYWVVVLYKKILGIPTVLDMNSTIDENIQFADRRDWITNIKFSWYLFKELSALTYTDALITVSERMKDYYSSKYKCLPPNTITIPNSLSNKLECWEPEKRLISRSNLDVSNKFLFIYAGGTQKWQCIDEMLKLFVDLLDFSEFRALQPLFLLLTWGGKYSSIAQNPKTKMPSAFIKEYSVEQPDVQKFMMAADVGVIYRENLTTNHVSCPTKTGEYLASGLPILCTLHAGDIPKIIQTHNVGYVISDPFENKKNLIDWCYYVQENRMDFARRSVNASHIYFGSDKLSQISGILNNLTFGSR